MRVVDDSNVAFFICWESAFLPAGSTKDGGLLYHSIISSIIEVLDCPAILEYK